MSPTSNSLARSVLIFSLALLGLLAGVLAWRIMNTLPQASSTTLIELPEPRVIADFALVDDEGQPFSLDELRGRWSVLFFGFTSCPDICPNTLFQLSEVRSALAEDLEPGPIPEFYLVSVDPERDTPEKLASYLAYFDPEFTGLTGDDPQLRALTMQLGVMYHIEPHDADAAEYSVDHSASLLVLDPEARLHGVLPAPHDADRIAADLSNLLRRQGRG